MRKINDEWIITVIQKNGPVPVQFFKELLQLGRDDGTYQYIKRHLKSLALYRIVERVAYHGVYYYRMPGDTRQIIELKRHDLTARINEEVSRIPEGTRITVKEIADRLEIPAGTVRRALRLNKELTQVNEPQKFGATIYTKGGH